MEKIRNATVLRQEIIATDIYSMWIETPLADTAVPGQFLSLYPKDASRLLPRPISICEREEGKLRIVYRIAGGGTAEFSSYHAGDTVRVLGPLGNGFPKEEGHAMLIGGGIGLPPLLGLAKSLSGDTDIICGFRNETFLTDELSSCG
ncbi:MAG: dihydroorotate dehydrogenase electron transfer subunit, partial [Lachnospiraceae bacterium]|nr:dihydroorotate dehydrogenase electron transfer subunit [Lachnospiraceae bacterium]